MATVVCRCGYSGEEMIEYETHTPAKQRVQWLSSYYDVIKTETLGVRTLNWACPKCGKVLMQHRGGWSYNHGEFEALRKRLWHNSWQNERWLRQQAKKLAGVNTTKG